jgi:hypothetical protein
MLVEFRGRRYFPERIPFVSLGEISCLLREWGLSEKIISRLVVSFEMCPLGSLRVGDYLGYKDGTHHIRLAFSLFGKDRRELNLTVIHELRHMYWNIVKGGTLISSDGFSFRPEWSGSGDEEKDCQWQEKKYGKRKLVTFRCTRKMRSSLNISLRFSSGRA